VTVVADPIYLSEPLVKSQDLTLNLEETGLGGCLGGNWLDPCEYVDETPGRPKTDVPSYNPGENPFVREIADRNGIPVDAVFGCPETMYPEYRGKLRALMKT
jgi:hypothetical protein